MFEASVASKSKQSRSYWVSTSQNHRTHSIKVYDKISITEGQQAMHLTIDTPNESKLESIKLSEVPKTARIDSLTLPKVSVPGTEAS